MADNWINVQRVRDACRLTGLGAGDRIIDVGCGPLGALPIFHEVVGPSGTVVGLDENEQLLRVAKGILRKRGFDSVMLIERDINQLPAGDLLPPGPFDAAYCRLLLINQTDPANTLRRMASLVRPSGYIIAHELLDDLTYPVFDPPVPAFSRLRDLWRELLRRNGITADAARHFAELSEQAGLRQVSQQGFFSADPRDAPAFIQSDGLAVILSIAGALRHHGLANEIEISELASELEEATSVTYRCFFSWIFVELIAQVPGSAA
ncbi:MAG TPA: class I SAM-dependent methyltransferase [Thermoanaerobaculia bacterium]|jgi:ubiquinone/menaquinone biosynthesis C-methylase UbiE